MAPEKEREREIEEPVYVNKIGCAKSRAASFTKLF
jgi:hypothetical protein